MTWLMMSLGMGDVLTCLLANLCSQLGLQLPSPQLVVPPSSSILLPLCSAKEVILWSGGGDPIASNVTAAFNVSVSVGVHLYLHGQAHNSFSCCSCPPTLTNSMICWRNYVVNLVQLSVLLDRQIPCYWWVNMLWIFGSYSSLFHSTVTFSE